MITNIKSKKLKLTNDYIVVKGFWTISLNTRSEWWLSYLDGIMRMKQKKMLGVLKKKAKCFKIELGKVPSDFTTKIDADLCGAYMWFACGSWQVW